MNFGIFLLMQSPSARPSSEVYPRALEIGRLAERLDFETIWLAEHHFTNYSHCSQPFVFLSNLAAVTRRIRLGTAIVPMPLHNPLFVAEQAATVDVLSEGRLELGFGKGYQQYQFDRLNIEKNTDPAAFRESVDLTVTALRGDAFTFAGDTIAVPEMLLYPQPVQRPPPVWLVVNSKDEAAVAAAVSRGFNLFTGVLEPISRLTNVRKQVEAVAPEGTAGRRVRIGTQRPVFVTESDDEALEIVEEARWNGRVSLGMRHDIARIEKGVAIVNSFLLEPSAETILEDHIIAGTPDRCVHQISRIRDGLGACTFNCSFWFGNMDQDKVLGSMELFARKVMPAFASASSDALSRETRRRPAELYQ